MGLIIIQLIVILIGGTILGVGIMLTLGRVFNNIGRIAVDSHIQRQKHFESLESWKTRGK
jgi:hypothetical protein